LQAWWELYLVGNLGQGGEGFSLYRLFFNLFKHKKLKKDN